MGVNIAGLVVLVVFYLVILVVGVLAARRKKQNGRTSQMESSIVADRSISTLVGIFTMTGILFPQSLVHKEKKKKFFRTSLPLLIQ